MQVIENKDKTGTGFSHFTLAVQQINKNAPSEDNVAPQKSTKVSKKGSKKGGKK